MSESATTAGQWPDLLWRPFNDYGNAQRLIDAYGCDLRYCSPMKKWLIWDGCRYRIDEKDEIRRLTQEVMLGFARQAVESGNDATARFAGKCLNSQRLSSAIREAQPLLAVSPQELDSDPYLLNFRNGTLDLRTLELFPHSRTQLITKLVHYRFNQDALCPQYFVFMQRILDSLVPYVQKAAGYSVTGATSEKVAFVCHGPTNSGKTTFLELMRRLFEDYSTLILVDSLMSREQEDNNSRADLADLRGARFVMTSETEEGQRLKEGKLKRLTQGQGLIKAVRKYENPIQFPETHKLWMDTNHKPLIRGTDDSIWNRLVIIPFEHPLSAVEVDDEMPQKLLQEAEGIISWVVRGTHQWRQERLGRIAPVDAARHRWRSEMDRLAAFRRACCVASPTVQSTARPLYVAYRHWAEEAGERALSETAFGLRLSELGFEKGEDGRGRVLYRGIGLLEDYEANEAGFCETRRPT
jgi:putative DNA primase/helicase